MPSSSSSSSSNQDTKPQKKSNPENPRVYNAVTLTDELPIKDSQRTCTDIFCVVVGVSFTVLLIIIGVFVFDYEKYVKSNFPTDSEGKLCGVDYPAYPYVYFAQPPQISRRVCVSKCPEKGDKALSCRMTPDVGCKFTSTPGYEVEYYESSHEKNRIGMFCLPKDQKIQDQLLANSNLSNKYRFINSLDAILLSFFIGLAVSAIYALATQFFPKIMNKVGTIGGIVTIIIYSIALLVYSAEGSSQFIVAIIALVVAAILIFTVMRYWKTLGLQGIFLKRGADMLKEHWVVYLYILLFMVFLYLFAVILVLEFSAFWGGGHLIFDKNESIFYIFKSGGAVLGTFILAIQAIWGLSFLKEAFNFVISGYAVMYYFKKQDQNDDQKVDGENKSESSKSSSSGHSYREEISYDTSPFKNLWCKHLGSVIACAFMTGFFAIGDFFFDLIKPSDNDEEVSCRTKLFAMSCCRSMAKLCDLVRSDSMGYINLTGNTFCNSARYCQYLCDQSRILEYSQSCSRLYRFGAHLFIACLIGIISLYMKGTIAPFASFVIVIMTIFVCTFFVSIHADAAEAILILFLTWEELEKRKIEKKNKNFNRFSWKAFKQIDFGPQKKLKKDIRKFFKQQDNVKDFWRDDQLNA